jgi:hypothetical protein
MRYYFLDNRGPSVKIGHEREVAKMFKTVVLVCVVVGAAAAFGYEHELRWDNGRFGLQLNYARGAGTWFANDFDTSGLLDQGYD